jgi:hypothetical protein
MPLLMDSGSIGYSEVDPLASRITLALSARVYLTGASPLVATASLQRTNPRCGTGTRPNFRIARYSGAIPSSVAGRFGMVPSTGSRLMERLISHKATSGSLPE